jgi:ribosomal protein S18 acetylase RimI-like enzyme
MEMNIEQKENNPINLQEATISDIPTLIEIEKSVSGKTYLAMLNEDEWKKELQTNKVYLIKKDNNAVGDLCYRSKNKDVVYISGLVIIPPFQGKGLAREAMISLMQELKDIDRVELVTHPDNLKAIKLYESLGFVVELRKENYYGDGEPRLVLARVNNKS